MLPSMVTHTRNLCSAINPERERERERESERRERERERDRKEERETTGKYDLHNTIISLLNYIVEFLSTMLMFHLQKAV